jgi:hypothetical protein
VNEYLLRSEIPYLVYVGFIAIYFLIFPQMCYVYNVVEFVAVKSHPPSPPPSSTTTYNCSISTWQMCELRCPLSLSEHDPEVALLICEYAGGTWICNSINYSVAVGARLRGYKAPKVDSDLCQADNC